MYIEQFDNLGVLSACDLVFWFSDRLLTKYTSLLLIDGPQPKHFGEQLTPPFRNSHRPPMCNMKVLFAFAAETTNAFILRALITAKIEHQTLASDEASVVV